MASFTKTALAGVDHVSADKALDAYWLGFKQLLAQQLLEIEIVSATFDYSAFAGANGPLSGPGSGQ